MLRVIVGVAILLAVLGWAWVILGVAVFAIPDRYSGPVAVAYSVIAVTIGIAVPLVVVWIIRALELVPLPARTPISASVLLDPADDTSRSLNAPSDTLSPELIEPPTERELEVLRYLAEGKSNKEIARDMVISTGTVKTHTNNLYRKLGARNRTEAAARARQLDLL